MKVAIRAFEKGDIPYKVKWINDERNNKYLHYELPLREDKTLKWFNNLELRNDRVDLTITYDGEPAGLIGLLNINKNKGDAEYYICLGEDKYKGKGVANIATELLIKKAYNELELTNIYLFTEIENVRAQKLFEKSGFVKKELLKKDLFYNEKHVDRYLYNLDLKDYFQREGE